MRSTGHLCRSGSRHIRKSEFPTKLEFSVVLIVLDGVVPIAIRDLVSVRPGVRRISPNPNQWFHLPAPCAIQVRRANELDVDNRDVIFSLIEKRQQIVRGMGDQDDLREFAFRRFDQAIQVEPFVQRSQGGGSPDIHSITIKLGSEWMTGGVIGKKHQTLSWQRRAIAPLTRFEWLSEGIGTNEGEPSNGM